MEYKVLSVLVDGLKTDRQLETASAADKGLSADLSKLAEKGFRVQSLNTSPVSGMDAVLYTFVLVK